MEIEWHTVPPLSPHFGGLWEAGVKLVKFHLKRVVGSINLTFEEFYTLLTQIEAVLNSRQLRRLVDNDIDSLNVLTPSHFLVDEEVIGPPETVE
ncbi:integrase catalytic domain-containing protein [Trichonephila clavipes]|nr:integrase catalytic domain-containing protein [Trichonephila clavipes]